MDMTKELLKKEVDHIKGLPPSLQIYYIWSLSQVMLLQRIDSKLYNNVKKDFKKMLGKAIDNLDGSFEDQIAWPLRRVSVMSMSLSAGCKRELIRLRKRVAGKPDALRVVEMMLNNIKFYQNEMAKKKAKLRSS
jgi:hypothetical protein